MEGNRPALREKILVSPELYDEITHTIRDVQRRGDNPAGDVETVERLAARADRDNLLMFLEQVPKWAPCAVRGFAPTPALSEAEYSLPQVLHDQWTDEWHEPNRFVSSP